MCMHGLELLVDSFLAAIFFLKGIESGTSNRNAHQKTSKFHDFQGVIIHSMVKIICKHTLGPSLTFMLK